jgi:hypothetical protein
MVSPIDARQTSCYVSLRIGLGSGNFGGIGNSIGDGEESHARKKHTTM